MKESRLLGSLGFPDVFCNIVKYVKECLGSISSILSSPILKVNFPMIKRKQIFSGRIFFLFFGEGLAAPRAFVAFCSNF